MDGRSSTMAWVRCLPVEVDIMLSYCQWHNSWSANLMTTSKLPSSGGRELTVAPLKKRSGRYSARPFGQGARPRCDLGRPSHRDSPTMGYLGTSLSCVDIRSGSRT